MGSITDYADVGVKGTAANESGRSAFDVYGTKYRSTGMRLAGIALAVIGLLCAVTNGGPRHAAACSYLAGTDLASEVLSADGVAIVEAIAHDDATDLTTVRAERWVARPDGIGNEFPADVPLFVCSGPNGLKPGRRYLLIFDLYEEARRLPLAAHTRPWWGFDVTSGILAALPWEGAGGPTRTVLLGQSIDGAIAMIRPYRDLVEAMGSPPLAAYERNFRWLTLTATAWPPRHPGLKGVTADYPRVIVASIAASEPGMGASGPRTRQILRVEDWVLPPPPAARTEFVVEQRAVDWGPWSLVHPFDPLMQPGDRYLMFGAGQNWPAFARFRIVHGRLRPASKNWFDPQLAEVLGGLTEVEAIARIRECIVFTRNPKKGGRPAITDRCAT